MADNITPEQEDPKASSRQASLDAFNKSIGLNPNLGMSPANSNYNPRPSSIDLNNKVVGNPSTGSNPGQPKMSLTDLNKGLQDLNAFNVYNTEVNNRKVQEQSDPHDRMRQYTYNGDFDGANFERYYNSNAFNKLGFSPYRDNETLYNNNMTAGDEFVRAAGQWPSLVSTGFSSGIRSWGTLFTDPLAPDLQGAREMQRSMAIGSASKGGVSSFLTNTFLNSGYTIGIGAEMLAETLALAGATALTGGLDAGVTVPTWMTRMGLGATKIAQGAKTVEDMKNLSKISQIKTFWQANQYGKALGVVGRSINPLENTWEVGKDIASGANALKYTDEATGIVNKFAQYSKNFGEFAKDIIMTKAAVSEAQLEGGMVQIDTTKELIQRYRETHGGLDPEGEELARIENIAKEESHRTAFWNLPAIMWSNKFMYETMFAPFEKSAKKGMENLGKDLLFKEGKGFTAVAGGLSGTLQKVGAGITSPKAWGKFSYDYLKMNAPEGVQENLQEAISSGAKAHALATYNNPDRGAYEGYMGHFMNGMKQQFSAQGAETFAGGFIMGAMAKPFMAAPIWAGQTAWNNTVNKAKHQEYKTERKTQLDASVKTLNEFYKDSATYLAPDMVNAIKQGALQKDFHQANVDNNRKEAEDKKSLSKFEHLYTALHTGKFDIVLDKFKSFKELSPEDAAVAFKVKNGADALAMIDDVIARAESIKNNYEEISSSYPNPYNPFKYKKGTEEHEAHGNAYNSWEEAKKNFIFARTEFENHSKRIEQLATTLTGKRNPIKNASAQDLLVLMDRNQMEITTRALRQEIKATDSSTPEGRKLIAEKQKKFDLLTDLANHFEYLAPTTVGEKESDRRTINKNAKKVFRNYIDHIAKTSGDFVFDEDLEHAYDLIKDNHTLRDERAYLIKSINVLNDPKGFLNLQRSLQTIFADINNTKVEEVAKRSKNFANKTQIERALNELVKKAGVYLTPEDTSLLQNQMDNNLVISTPKSFIDATDPNSGVISDSTDSKFIKAIEEWTNIAAAIQTDYPVDEKLDTKEDIEKARTRELDAIKVDLLKLNNNTPFYTVNAKYVLVDRGTTLENTIIGEPPFGDDISASELGGAQTYSEDPTSINKKYDALLSNLGKERGKLIYSTKGSGKSTAVKNAETIGNLIDADDLLVKQIKIQFEKIYGTPLELLPGETPQQTILGFAKEVSKEQKEELYNIVRGQIEKLVAQGKTVLTGSTDFIKDADIVYLQEDDKRIGLSNALIIGIRERELTALKESGKTGTPLSGDIGEKLIIPVSITSELETKKAELIKERDAELADITYTGDNGDYIYFTNKNPLSRYNTDHELRDAIIARYVEKLADLEKPVIVTPEYEKISTTLDTITMGKLRGKDVRILGDPMSYFVYKNPNSSTYRFVSYLSPEATIATSDISEDDAIEKGYAALQPDIIVTPIVDINEQLTKINKIKDFNSYDKIFDEVTEIMTGQSVDNDLIVSKAFTAKFESLMTTLTPENLSQAKKRSYKIIVDSKIYSNFTINKTKKTVNIKSPLGTKGTVFPIPQIERITTMDELKPLEVTPETKEQVKEIITTASEVISSDDFQKASDEFNTESNDNITKDFFDNLGCK